ncbi:rhamnosyltransferase [Aurantimicrobium minutum]|uniref:glycosyltransferase family 2 protein n=1 Tax=Aurantimicrobium minutum TaxID=708131 RepID=UPI002475564E|nr:glycosyltransferase family 2 protein [Aurantimicrobium minutum]MDH6425085.1 rhamnosyltransferase [Aurantimicrobium minutum]
MKQPLVTVFIPTYNGETYLEVLLQAVIQQVVDFEFEIQVIDSGSTDQTLEILNKFHDISILQIPNAEFSHGRTRNLAAQIARGIYIVFLTQDAIPSSKHWLASLIDPMRKFQQVMGVVGKQTPRKNCPPYLKYDIQMVFDRQGASSAVSLFQLPKHRTLKQWEYDICTFYSDVNSATRVDLLKGEIPLRDVDYSEDIYFAQDILSAGYVKAYSPDAEVIHSNDLTLRQVRKRLYDETTGLINIGVELGKFGIFNLFSVILKKSLGDQKRIINDISYSFSEKIKWSILNPCYVSEKWIGYFLAINFRNRSNSSKYSLEHGLRGDG